MTSSKHRSDQLIERLTLGNAYERYEAASRLAEFSRESVVMALSKTLTSDQRWEVRQAAAVSLGKICSSAAYEVLLQALDDRSRYVRTSAVSSLGQLGDRRAIPVLCALLKKSAREDSWAIVNALMAIARGGSRYRNNTLDERLLDDRDVCECLIEIPHDLLDWHIVHEIGYFSLPQAEAALIDLLDPNRPDLCDAAMYGIWRVKSKNGLKAMVEIVNCDVDRLRESAIRWIKQLDVQLLAPHVPKLLHDQNTNVRALGAELVADLELHEFEPRLIELLSDSDTSVRIRSTWSLKQLKCVAAAESLCRLLEDDDEFVRRWAADALATFGDARFNYALEQYVAKERGHIEQSVSVYLGKKGTHKQR
jgi:hypothetical protein